MLLRTAVGQNRMRLRRGTAELWRRLAKAPHRVEYFHQVDDPYSHLAAQALSRLTDRYEIELVPHLVAQPTDAATPEREMLTAYARRDAAAVAPHFEISFQDPGRQPQNAAVRRTERALAAALAGGPFAELAPRLGEALWSGREDPAGLATPEATAERLAEGSERRKALGGYLPARSREFTAVQAPPASFLEAYASPRQDRAISTTQVYGDVLRKLLKDKSIGKYIVPIIPDEARTFGLDALFRQVGIYSAVGQ
ncbi:MAG: hypothetical protein QF391_16810, partial [Myxococcota bacterium]|nr:hypothetical protein [Myxococcota bacterium]